MNVIRGSLVVIVLIQAMLLSGVANAGTINNADISVNGQLEQFDLDPANNWYTFTLSSSGNVLFSGIDNSGGDLRLQIFDAGLQEVFSGQVGPTVTASLEAGDYFMQVCSYFDCGSRTGTFTFTSTFLKPECGAPSPDYTAGFNAGEAAGEAAGGGFYVIPIPVPAN